MPDLQLQAYSLTTTYRQGELGAAGRGGAGWGAPRALRGAWRGHRCVTERGERGGARQVTAAEPTAASRGLRGACCRELNERRQFISRRSPAGLRALALLRCQHLGKRSVPCRQPGATLRGSSSRAGRVCLSHAGRWTVSMAGPDSPHTTASPGPCPLPSSPPENWEDAGSGASGARGLSRPGATLSGGA